jgi:hypothetical protein
MDQAQLPMRRDGSSPPVDIPPGHVGPLTLPGSEREIWWTGRVAIGLRFERQHTKGTLGQSAAWVQDLLLQPWSGAR